MIDFDAWLRWYILDVRSFVYRFWSLGWLVMEGCGQGFSGGFMYCGGFKILMVGVVW